MESGLTRQTRRELIQYRRQAYQAAKRTTKGTILDEVCQLTGYHRTYARWLLTHPETLSSGDKRGRPCQYGPEVQHVLFLAWHAANRICPCRICPPGSTSWSDKRSTQPAENGRVCTCGEKEAYATA